MIYDLNFYTQMCVIQLRTIHLRTSTESHIQSIASVIA